MTLCILSYICSCVHAQEIIVSLTSKDGESYIGGKGYFPIPIQDKSIYKIDSSQFTNNNVWIVAMNQHQYLYEKETKHFENDKIYQNFINKDRNFNFGNTITRRLVPKNIIPILSGINLQGENIIVVDQNRNHDFSDDKIYTFKSGEKDKIEKFNIPIDIIITADEIITKPFTFSLTLPSPGSTVHSGGKLVDFRISNNEYYEGNIIIGMKKYLIQINNNENLHNKNSINRSEIKILSLPIDSSSKLFNKEYLLADTIHVGNDLVTAKYQNNKIYLNKVGHLKNINAIPEFREKDLLTGEIISNHSLKGKYTLIDFWGSWCGPCIKGLPHIVELYKKYGDKINFLSIASDYSDDLDKLKGLINQYNLTWAHIWSNRSISYNSRLTTKFYINSYPTIILLDKETNEIKRFYGILDSPKLDKALNEIMGF